MNWLRRRLSLGERGSSHVGLRAPARSHTVTPDQDGVVALGNAIPATVGHDPRTKRRAYPVKLALGKSRGQLIYRTDVEIADSIKGELQVRRNP